MPKHEAPKEPGYICPRTGRVAVLVSSLRGRSPVMMRFIEVTQMQF